MCSNPSSVSLRNTAVDLDSPDSAKGSTTGVLSGETSVPVTSNHSGNPSAAISALPVRLSDRADRSNPFTTTRPAGERSASAFSETLSEPVSSSWLLERPNRLLNSSPGGDSGVASQLPP